MRSEWVARHALGGATSLADAAARGWNYQTGGSGAYLALRARFPAMRRQDADDAVADGSLVIVTGVRGCTFLVPAADAPMARAAWGAHVAPTLDPLRRMGMDLPRLRALCDEVEAAADSPLEPHAIRARVTRIEALDAPRFGLSNTLPLALRVLESEGRLTRLPATGRLDDERYCWRRTPPEGPGTDVTRRYIIWNAPITQPQLASWLGVSQTVAGRRLVACGGERSTDGWRLDRVDGIDDDAVHFLPFRDPYVDFRTPMLVDPPASGRLVDGWNSNPTPIGKQPTVHHHTVVHRGAIVGVWEWSDRLEVGFFGEPPPGCTEARHACESWIREELGDVFIYAQDGADQRARRLEVVRGLMR